MFDNDGTRWSEEPTDVQLVSAIERARGLVRKRPERAANPVVAAAIGAGGDAGVSALGMQELLELLRANGFRSCIVSAGDAAFMRVIRFNSAREQCPADRQMLEWTTSFPGSRLGCTSIMTTPSGRWPTTGNPASASSTRHSMKRPGVAGPW